MKNYFYVRLFFFCLLLNVGHASAMLLTRRLLTHRLSLNNSTSMQKRFAWSHKNLSSLSQTLPSHLNRYSPAYGAALVKSPVLEHVMESPTPPGALSNLCFYHISPSEPIRPSNLVSTFNAEAIGATLGSLTHNGCIDEQTAKEINDVWNIQKNHILTANEFIKTIENAYQYNQDLSRDILIALLYEKANPENNQDMIEYGRGLNKYLPIFSESDDEFRSQVQQNFDITSNGFLKQYQILKEKIKNLPHYDAQIAYAKDNFSDVVSILIEDKIEASHGSPTVKFGKYGYQGQPAVSNCGEETMYAFLSFLGYDHDSQGFNLSLLPPSITVNASLARFYEKFPHRDHVNRPTTQQAFVDLISGLTEIDVKYKKNNYELPSRHFKKNFPKLCNHFFNITSDNSNNLEKYLVDLGKALSDKRRTVTFILEPHPRGEQVVSTIINHKENKTSTLAVCFNSGHTWTETIIEAPQEQWLNAEQLTSKDNCKSPMAKALFSLHAYPKINRQLLEKAQKNELDVSLSSLHYALPIVNDYEKQNIVLDILFYDNKNTESLAYAYSLLKELTHKMQADVMSILLDSFSFKAQLLTNPNLNQFKQWLEEQTNHSMNQTIIE